MAEEIPFPTNHRLGWCVNPKKIMVDVHYQPQLVNAGFSAIHWTWGGSLPQSWCSLSFRGALLISYDSLQYKHIYSTKHGYLELMCSSTSLGLGQLFSTWFMKIAWLPNNLKHIGTYVSEHFCVGTTSDFGHIHLFGSNVDDWKPWKKNGKVKICKQTNNHHIIALQLCLLWDSFWLE